MGFLPKPMKESELLQFLACKTFEIAQVGHSVTPAHMHSSTNELKHPSAPQPKKVLIVNDDDAMLFSMKMMLKSQQVQVLSAENVTMALKHLTEHKVDVIFSDINLGEKEPNGYELLKKVREKDAEMPFYFVSGYSQREEEPKVKKHGATGYLQLSVAGEQLKLLIN